MNEELESLYKEVKKKMNNTIVHLDGELAKIRAGKANPQMLNGVKIDYYGNLTPLSQVSNITSSDAKTIVVQPWEKQLIGDIEKAIVDANLGFNPDNNGEIIRINIPPLTEERRKELSKMVKIESEKAKVSVRNARRETIETLKKMKKDGLEEDLEKNAESEVQTITNSFTKKIDEIVKTKDAEIMKV